MELSSFELFLLVFDYFLINQLIELRHESFETILSFSVIEDTFFVYP